MANHHCAGHRLCAERVEHLREIDLEQTNHCTLLSYVRSGRLVAQGELGTGASWKTGPGRKQFVVSGCEAVGGFGAGPGQRPGPVVNPK